MEKVYEKNQSERYYYLVRLGQLKQKAEEINEEANELLDRIMQQYLQKHKPENPGSTMEMWQLREQTKAKKMPLEEIGPVIEENLGIYLQTKV